MIAQCPRTAVRESMHIEVSMLLKIRAELQGNKVRRTLLNVLSEQIADLLIEDPHHQRILVFEVIVETLPVQLTHQADVGNGYLLQCLGLHALLQRIGQRLLRNE